MKLRCPVCHSSNSLEAFAADDAARELLVLLSKSGPLFRPLVNYLGLFRSSNRDLSHSRALKLVQDVLEISANPQTLSAALSETVEAMQAKRQQGDNRPLKNHNYLKRVLESLPPALAADPNLQIADFNSEVSVPRGKRAQAINALGNWAGDNWLRREIAQGLAALIGLGRQGAPAADSVVVTAGLWESLLISKGITIEQLDQSRIYNGFKELLNNFDTWPEPKDLLARMPRRPERQKLETPPSADDIAKGKDFFKGLRERF